jgi:DNA polymerase III subunit delta
MGVHLITGDDAAMVGSHAHDLVHRLMGEHDPSLILDDFDPALGEVDMTAVVDAAATPPLFTPSRVVVLRGVGELTAAQISVLTDYLDAPLPTTDLVLVSTGGRLPKAFTTAVEKAGGSVVSVGVPSSKAARQKWFDTELAASGLRVDPAAAHAMLGWLGDEPSRLGGLLDTLTAAMGPGARVHLDDVTPHLGDSGGVPPWELTDAIERGDTARALDVLHRLMRGGERHPLQILATLHGHIGRVARLDGSGAHDAEAAAAVLGLRPQQAFQAKKALELQRRWGSAAIAKGISWLAQADVDLRGGTDWPPELVMEVLVARLSRLKR